MPTVPEPGQAAPAVRRTSGADPGAAPDPPGPDFSLSFSRERP